MCDAHVPKYLNKQNNIHLYANNLQVRKNVHCNDMQNKIELYFGQTNIYNRTTSL